jgi:RNA polymerase sigma factor (sigma-70 family)
METGRERPPNGRTGRGRYLSDAKTSFIVKKQQEEAEELRELIRAHYEFVYHYAYRRCRDEDTAAEVTLDTFSAVIRRPELVHGRRDQLIWLLGVARNKLREARRRRFTKKRLEELFTSIWPFGVPDTAAPLFAVEPPDPVETASAQYTISQVWAAAQRLPENQLEAFLLKYAEQLSTEEIAKVMKCTPRTVDRLIERARNTIFLEIQPQTSCSGDTHP